MKQYQSLIAAFGAATPGSWGLLGKYHNVAFGLSDSNDALGHVFGCGPLAEANALFICQAQNLMSAILADLQRLQGLEAELRFVRERTTVLESMLGQSSSVMQAMREQIEQMRSLFNDEDGAIQACCEGHDGLSELIRQALKS